MGSNAADDVGVLCELYMNENNNIVFSVLMKEGSDGYDHVRLMDAYGVESVGVDITNVQPGVSALANFVKALGYTLDDVTSQYGDITGPIYRLPSDSFRNENFNDFGYAANQNSYIDAMSMMAENDSFTVFVNGIYVENKLVRSSGSLVYRTYLLPCSNPAADSAKKYSYEGSYNLGFDITNAISCQEQVSTSGIEDWWDQLGVQPLPYQFERQVYYVEGSIRRIPLMFVEY